jgi:hypothetical protein
MAHPSEMLKEFGRQLDVDIFPRIMNGGIVTPGDAAVIPTKWAEEKEDERQRERRPTTRPWTGTTRGKGETGRSWSTNCTASPISRDLQTKYEGDLGLIDEAYPGAKVWHQAEGLLLVTDSSLLPGLCHKARFFTAIPFSPIKNVRSWGFWVGVPLSHPVWIGPRHTNLGDGSICAFERQDDTWLPGDSLVTLLDLYTVWALRHLYLQILGRWPGRQVAHYAFERLVETQSGELCGCGSKVVYSSCCRERDLLRERLPDALRFIEDGGFDRNPPAAVSNFISGRSDIPYVTDLL